MGGICLLRAVLRGADGDELSWFLDTGTERVGGFRGGSGLLFGIVVRFLLGSGDFLADEEIYISWWW